MASSTLPVCLTFVLCEAVVRNEESGRQSLLDLFDSIDVPELPWPCRALTVFFELSNVTGSIQPVIRLAAEPAGHPHDAGQHGLRGLAGWMLPATMPAVPRDVVAVAAGLAGITFPRAGSYWFLLEHDGRLLMGRRCEVRLNRRP